uniref:Uncharacterized protein n=1 Tax=Glossina austeni TaxID=7395 RepID=A0A1A9V5Q5_GLOAU
MKLLSYDMASRIGAHCLRTLPHALYKNWKEPRIQFGCQQSQGGPMPVTGLQALPLLLTNLHEGTRKISANFLHELHVENIKHTRSLIAHANLSLPNATIFLYIIMMVIIISAIRKRTSGLIIIVALNTGDNKKGGVNTLQSNNGLSLNPITG